MSEPQYYLKIASTFSVLLPIFLLALSNYRKTWPYQLFLMFLAFGFLVDLSGWYFFLTENYNGNWIFRYSYSLVEPLFYFWWIGYFSLSRVVVKSTKIFMFLSIMFWLAIIFYQPAFSSYYIFTSVALAFFAGFLVLEIIENKKSPRLPLSFWIAFGIFFYHLSTFFVKGLINEQGARELWFIQNLVNITTNIIYAVGFWVCRDEFASGKLERQPLSNT